MSEFVNKALLGAAIGATSSAVWGTTRQPSQGTYPEDKAPLVPGADVPPADRAPAKQRGELMPATITALGHWADAGTKAKAAAKEGAAPLGPAPVQGGDQQDNALSKTQGPPNHTPEEMKKRAVEIIVRDNPREAANEFAKTLKDKNLSDADRGELYKQMLTVAPHLAIQMLKAGGDPGTHIHGDISKEDSVLIAHYLGAAYDPTLNKQDPQQDTYGKIGPEELKKLLDPKWQGMHKNPMDIAKLISMSGANSLQGDSAKLMLEIAKNDKSKFKNNAAYFASSAQAVSGNPKAAEELLKTVGLGGLEEFMNHGRPDALKGRGDLIHDPALGNFIAAVGNIKIDPAKPDPQLLQLKQRVFDLGVRMVDNDPSMRAGLSSYFQTNITEVTTRLGETGHSPEDTSTMVQFAQQVLFSDEKFDGQERARTAFAKNLQQRALALTKIPEGDKRKEELARQFGFLLGSSEAGFQRVLGDSRDKNKSREDLAGFLFDLIADPAKNLIPIDLKIPGIGSVKDKGIDALKSLLLNLTTKQLPDSNKVTRPLYETGLTIDKDYQDEMLAARGSVFDDEGMGYLK